MRLTADRRELAEAVKWVTGAISPRPSTPALSGLRIEATAGAVLLTGHDFDKVHSATVDATVTEPGVAVPVGMMLRDLLNALKGDTVDLSTDDTSTRLTLKAGRSTYGVNLFAPGTWPEFPVTDIAEVGTVEADDLQRGMALVVSAADDNNPVTRLRGVRLEGQGDELAIVGVSTTHLAVSLAPWAGDDFTAQLPIGSAADAVRGLSGSVAIGVSDGALSLTTEARSVVLRVFDGEGYPMWRKYLEGEATNAVEVEAELLRDACKRAALTCAAGNEPLTMDINGDLIKIVGGGDSAEGLETVDCISSVDSRADWTTSVLLPVLTSLPPTPVLLSFDGPAGASGQPPMMLTDKAGSFRHIVMPRRAS